MNWKDILPVLLSIIVIIVVAVLEKQSKFIAAITATMPLTAALAIWIVYSSSEGESGSMTDFSRGLVLGILPTIAFAIAAWLSFRAGLKLVPALAIAYGTWAVGVGLLVSLRRGLGL
ncbi:MAG: hypothetical protein ACK2T3_16955 [Candidatus Promineifilaceae bacterium]